MIDRGGRALLASVGLMADGPVVWGRPIGARGAGLYVVELPAPLPTAPLELTRVGKWIERLPALHLDGERPSSRALAARMASFWLPEATVIFVGATPSSIAGRVAALSHHVLGDRRPHADGQWLHALRTLEAARIWWAQTDAPEEYLDAVLDGFGAIAGRALPDRPTGSLLLPWANTRRPTGERQPTGITGSVLPDDSVRAPTPGTSVTVLEPGDADGVATDVRGTGTTRRVGDPASLDPSRAAPARGRSVPSPTSAAGVRKASAPSARTAGPRAKASMAAALARPAADPVHVTQEALDRMTTELDELSQRRRPEVVARIKAARELGDLKENADYQAAREEQSFLEGRIRMLEDRIRNAAVIEATGSPRVHLGSTVTIEPLGYDGEAATYTIVGSTEADPAAGRISSASPVGAALIGRSSGDEVDVRTPRGGVRYRVTSVS